MEQKTKIDFSKTTEINCDKCKKAVFESAFFLRKLSALVSPTGQEMIVPVQAMRCAACQHINESFIPN